MTLLDDLSALPGSYQGPTRRLTPQDAPVGLIGLGEAALAAELCRDLAPTTLVRGGAQLVLSSPETLAAADDFAALAEVSGVQVVRVGVGEGRRFGLDSLAYLAPGGVLSTYHLGQYVAHATGQGEAATVLEPVLADLRDRCAPHVQEGNPARELAWTLWGRAPLLLAPAGEDALIHAWQTLLARVGKVLSVPVAHNPLYTLTGAFEAHHERGDGRVALLLGEEDAELQLAREVLETRIDEVVALPYPGGPYPEGTSGYVGNMALWYFGAWVAAYLAEREGASPDDSPALSAVLGSLGTAVPGDEMN